MAKKKATKVGTIPMLVRFDQRTKLSLGAKMRFQTMWHGQWEKGTVTNLEPLRLSRG